MSKVDLYHKNKTLIEHSGVELSGLLNNWDFLECGEEAEICKGLKVGFAQKRPYEEADWSEVILNAFENLSRTLTLRIAEGFRIDSLEREIALLKKRISILEEAKPIIVPIETFDPEPYEVLKTFHVIIQSHAEEYVAYYFDANLSATGETKEEAIYNLKDIIIATFDALSSHDESKLGLGPLRQIKLLKKVIQKIS